MISNFLVKCEEALLNTLVGIQYNIQFFQQSVPWTQQQSSNDGFLIYDTHTRKEDFVFLVVFLLFLIVDSSRSK